MSYLLWHQTLDQCYVRLTDAHVLTSPQCHSYCCYHDKSHMLSSSLDKTLPCVINGREELEILIYYIITYYLLAKAIPTYTYSGNTLVIHWNNILTLVMHSTLSSLHYNLPTQYSIHNYSMYYKSIFFALGSSYYSASIFGISPGRLVKLLQHNLFTILQPHQRHFEKSSVVLHCSTTL